MASKFLILALAIVATVYLSPASAQITPPITPPCTPTMITSFTPCIPFVTNSTTNTTTPSAACCNSLQSLMGNGRNCLCLIATGSPFQIPINRTLAVSLPRACNMPGVPLQCSAAGAPVPAPAPGPSALSPSTSPSPSVAGLTPPEAGSPGLAPQADEAQTPPATPAANGGAPPTSTTGSRAGVTPSAAQPSYGISSMHLMVVLLGAIALKY